MRKALLSAIIVFSSTVAFAQNDAVTSAFFYQKDGKLDKAKTEIERALQNDKTKANAKTWYFAATIYRDIANQPDGSPYAGIDKDALSHALEAYQKTIQLDRKGGEYYQSAENDLKNIYGMAFNAGVKDYQAQKYEAALKNYEVAQKVNVTDTTAYRAYLYHAYAAESMKNYDLVKKDYQELFKLGYKKPEMYRTLAAIERQNKNDAEALKHIQAGRAEFPNDKTLAVEELALLSSAGRLGESIQKMEDAIKLDPENASLYAALASTQDQASKDTKRPQAERDELYKKSLTNFQKTLEKDPNNVVANFNLGVNYFNQGVVITKKVNNMTLNDYQKTGKKLEADAKALYTKSLPYFEKCYNLAPSEKEYSQTLKKVYMALGRKADADKIKE